MKTSKWTDMDAMFEAIIEHVKVTGHTIFCADDPGKPRWPPELGWEIPPTFGWMAADEKGEAVERWEITLWDARAHLQAKIHSKVHKEKEALPESLKGQIVWDSLGTAEGRRALIVSLEQAGKVRATMIDDIAAMGAGGGGTINY